MSMSLSNMVSQIEPKKTVLFFGSGSSIPSGAPSVEKLINTLSKILELDSDEYNLSEIASVAEDKIGRKKINWNFTGIV